MKNLILSVPNVIWAAIIASFLTFFGVLLTNLSFRKRQADELKHDAHQRERERQLSLKLDVYLEAAEAITRSQNLLTRLSDINIALEELSSDYQEGSAAINKIQLVGTNKTVQALSLFQTEFASVYLELIAERYNLTSIKTQIDINQKYIDKTLDEQERWIEIMQQFNLEGQHDQRAMDVLNQNYEHSAQSFERYSNENAKLWKDLGRKHIAFIELLFDRNTRLISNIPPAIFAVREELELPIDRDEYMKHFEESVKRNEDILKAFIIKAKALAESSQE